MSGKLAFTSTMSFFKDWDNLKETIIGREIKEVYNSIKEAPNYPSGFENRQNGTTKSTVKNKELLDKLRRIESGKWQKVYKDGYDGNGNKVSIHYFQSESGKVFNVKVYSGWSNKY